MCAPDSLEVPLREPCGLLLPFELGEWVAEGRDVVEGIGE